VDFLGILVGVTHRAAVEVHVRRLVRDAGVGADDDAGVQEVLAAATRERGWEPAALDAVTWAYGSSWRADGPGAAGAGTRGYRRGVSTSTMTAADWVTLWAVVVGAIATALAALATIVTVVVAVLLANRERADRLAAQAELAQVRREHLSSASAQARRDYEAGARAIAVWLDWPHSRPSQPVTPSTLWISNHGPLPVFAAVGIVRFANGEHVQLGPHKAALLPGERTSHLLTRERLAFLQRAPFDHDPGFGGERYGALFRDTRNVYWLTWQDGTLAESPSVEFRGRTAEEVRAEAAERSEQIKREQAHERAEAERRRRPPAEP